MATGPITPNAARRARRVIRESLSRYRDLRAQAVAALTAARASHNPGRVILVEEKLVIEAWNARDQYWRDVRWLTGREVKVGAAWSPNALARRRTRR